MKKAISIILVLIMAFSALSVVSYATDTSAYPTIYIKGQGNRLVTEKGDYYGTDIYPVEIPDGYIGDACKELAVPLAYSLVTDDWTDYGERLTKKITAITDPFKCDNDGNPIGNSGTAFTKSAKPETSPAYNGTGTFDPDFLVWRYEYDWRLDPVAIGKDLAKYVDYVLNATKAKKVNIIGRCLGANIVLSYINDNGISKINDCIFCVSGFEGYELIESIFAGTYEVDADAIERFTDTYLSGDDYKDDPSYSIIKDLVTCLNYSPALGYTSDVVATILDKLRYTAVPQILRESFATMPSFWSYLGEGSYEKAKEYILGGYEAEYAGLIEKIDDFHYNVLVNYDTILDNALRDGLKLYNVAKYGYQLMPLTGDDKTMSDSMVSTYRTSLGATCAEVDKTLSASYLAAADARFISPDKQVDASTCLIPEHTWFVKGISHRNMPINIETIYKMIINTDGYTTVFDNSSFPQYLVAKDEYTLVPITQDNAEISVNPDKEEKTTFAFFDLIINFFKMMFAKIKSWFGM